MEAAEREQQLKEVDAEQTGTVGAKQQTETRDRENQEAGVETE